MGNYFPLRYDVYFILYNVSDIFTMVNRNIRIIGSLYNVWKEKGMRVHGNIVLFVTHQNDNQDDNRDYTL